MTNLAGSGAEANTPAEYAPVSGNSQDECPLLLHSEPQALDFAKQLAPETKRLFRLAGPLVLQNICSYSIPVISAVFVGQLNDADMLSSAVLAGSFYNVTGLSIVIGLSAGMETLCGQAYGAKNYKMLGTVLQRALLICWIACLPVTAVWWNASHILSFLHMPAAITAGASRYLRLVIPSVYTYAVSSTLYRYLLAQKQVIPPSICTAVTACLCPLYNWLLVNRLNWDLEGAALAVVLSNATYSLLLLCYCIWRECWLAGTPRACWPGWSWKCLEGWGIYLNYGVPAAAMICVEWWVFEIVIFMAGWLPSKADVAVGVMGVSFHITSWSYMIPMALGTAVNTRVANELGAGHAFTARHAMQTALLLGACTQVCISVCQYSLRSQIVRIFTSNPDDDAMVVSIMPALAASVLGDGLNAVFSGVLRGCGRQGIGATMNLVGYWLVGFPLALLLGFHYGLGVVGFWLGLACATTLQAAIFAVVVARINWKVEVERAEKLVALHTDECINEVSEQLSGDTCRSVGHSWTDEEAQLHTPLLPSEHQGSSVLTNSQEVDALSTNGHQGPATLCHSAGKLTPPH